MKPVNMKDGGRNTGGASNRCFSLSPIAYNKEIADLAAERRIPYRELYIEALRLNDEA